MTSDARWDWVDVPVGTTTVRGITPVGRAETFYVRADVPQEATDAWARFSVRGTAGDEVVTRARHVTATGLVSDGTPADGPNVSADTSPGEATYLTCVLDPGDVLIGVRLSYRPEPGEFVPVAPQRVFDSSDILPESERVVDVSLPWAQGGIHAVHLNVTVTGVDGAGYLTVWPAGQPRPATSNVAWGAAGLTSAVGTTVGVGPSPTNANGYAVSIYQGGGVRGFPSRVIMDLTGYYRV